MITRQGIRVKLHPYSGIVNREYFHKIKWSLWHDKVYVYNTVSFEPWSLLKFSSLTVVLNLVSSNWFDIFLLEDLSTKIGSCFHVVLLFWPDGSLQVLITNSCSDSCLIQLTWLITLWGHYQCYRVDRYSCHPLISLCARMEKTTESWTGHPLKWQSPELATPKLTKVLDSANFWGWQILDSVISEVGQFRTLLFSPFWHIGK